MRLIAVVLRRFEVKDIKKKDGSGTFQKFVFHGHEVDFTGTAIPLEVETLDPEVRDILTKHLNKDQILIPFTKVEPYKGVNQVQPDKNLIKHPDCILSA